MTLAKSFGELNFGDVQLGDKRRNERFVDLVDQMVLRPGGTLPQKFRKPADLQAFYRLLKSKPVTHQAILDSHRQATLNSIGQREHPVLILHDTTELEYTKKKSLTKLGQIGNGYRRGYITHNSLAVDSISRDVLGLCNQILHCRAKVPKQETQAQRKKRKTRESRLWVDGTEPLPGDPQLVDVCDRGADTTEFLRHELASGRRFVIRSAHNRSLVPGHGEFPSQQRCSLHDFVAGMELAGTWTLEVSSKCELKSPRRKGKKKLVKRIKRKANMGVAYAPVELAPTESGGRMPIWVVRVWELDPPEGQERLEWTLLTNEPVASFEDAYRLVGWYECRWIIEEYHKGMKTGARIEDLQFTHEDRLQPAIAVLSVVTITLLQLRSASKGDDAHKRLAIEVISPLYVKVLSHWRHKEINLEWSVHEFYYALARLGGHQNRKHDHPPGWQVLWEGWKELLPMAIGYDAAMDNIRCG